MFQNCGTNNWDCHNEVQIGQTLEQILIYLEKINTPQPYTIVIRDSSPTNFILEEEALRIKSRFLNFGKTISKHDE